MRTENRCQRAEVRGQIRKMKTDSGQKTEAGRWKRKMKVEM
jgi:hypothetical protein